MSRLCERPGCSELGAAEYGMVPEDLLFWIAPLSATPFDGQSVLCLRHADAMSVPRGWMLDDRREEIPRLFMPRPWIRPDRTRNGARPRRTRTPDVEQLQIDGTGEIVRPALIPDAEDAPDVPPPVDPEDAAAVGSETNDTDVDEPNPGSEVGAPWAPSFDQDNDLDGLLKVSSPLLARAFRGTDRPRD
ncbi:MAG: DUF3499 family protein [Ilumatobacteraceae bacterium]